MPAIQSWLKSAFICLRSSFLALLCSVRKGAENQTCFCNRFGCQRLRSAWL